MASALRLLHVTDTHLFATAGTRLRGVDTGQTLTAVLDHALGSGTRPDAVLATGDLSQDETAGSYVNFRRLTAERGLPVWCVPGNHDIPALLGAGLNGAPFTVGGHVVAGGWCIALLDSWVAGDHGGRLSAESLTALAQLLEAQRSRHVLIAVHHHVLPVGSRWLDELGLSNADELLALIDRHPQVRGIVAGHVHQASDQQRNGVRVITTPSTCFQFLPAVDDFALDTRPPGYRWLELLPDGNIRTNVVEIDPP